MKPYEIIQSLEATNSRNAKEDILSSAADEITCPDHDVFFAGCKLALDPHVTFYLQQIPAGASGGGLSFFDFTKAADALATRAVTGNAARALVEELRNQATDMEWNFWYRRILLKDLKCGVTEKTINKILKARKLNDYIIRVFTCQLANDSSDHQNAMTGEKIVETKLDGVRAIAILTASGCTLYSRTGKVLNNFSHIARAIEQLPHAKASASNSVWGGVVFDGEVMSASFQDLMKQLYRKEHVDSTDSVYHMFDVLPLADFLAGRCSEQLVDRIAALKTLLLDSDPCLQSLDQEFIDLDADDGQKKFVEINRAAIDAGYEGIMIKDPSSPYECKRSNSWLKLKPFIDLSLSIGSSEEGTGKHTGKLGAFQCSGVENDRHISVSVGSGFSDEQRESFWADRESLLGHIVEVRADAITQNQDGTFSLRFPRFLRFRGREAGEKL